MNKKIKLKLAIVIIMIITLIAFIFYKSKENLKKEKNITKIELEDMRESNKKSLFKFRWYKNREDLSAINSL